MKEILSLGIGGFGVNSLDLINQDLAEDHFIGMDGMINKDDTQNNHYPETYFQEMSNGKYCARSLLIDGDDMAIDNIRSGDSANLYMLDNYSYSNIQSGGLFSKGFYSIDSDFIETVKEKVRKQIEICDKFLGFQFHYSLGGGIGSGLGSLIVDQLKEIYPNVNPKMGNFLSYATFFRGKMFSDIDLSYKLRENQKTHQDLFVEWLPDHGATGVVYKDFLNQPTTQAAFFGTSTAIQAPLKRLSEDYYRLFRRRAYLYKYFESGMEEMDFTEKENNLLDIISEYQPFIQGQFEDEYGDEVADNQ
eukprot:403337394